MNGRLLKGTALGILAIASAFACADTVQVTVDGNPINFPDAQPQMVNDRVLVPLRGVFESLGATVLWDQSTQTISAYTATRHVKLLIGNREANVDGRIVEMDTAPQIFGASTLVPLRFLSQSLGARVDWQPQQNLVAISTRRDRGYAQQIQAAPQVQPGWDTHARTFVLSNLSVIPLRLDQPLSSNGNHEGDQFSATVRGDRDGYLDLPQGSRVTGVVRRAYASRDGRPGALELRFTNLVLPDGASYPIYGTVASLNDPNIVKTGDGRFIARNNSDVKNNIGRDAAIGAGAGFVLGSMHARAIGGAAVGGVLGAVIGAFTADHHDNNIRIDRGTRLGLILSRDLSVSRKDLRQ